jgi:hypothetical protein
MRWEGHVAWDKWEVHTKLSKNLKGRDRWGDLVVNGRIILKRILNKSDSKLWTGFLRFKLGSWKRPWTFGFHKRARTSWPSERTYGFSGYIKQRVRGAVRLETFEVVVNNLELRVEAFSSCCLWQKELNRTYLWILVVKKNDFKIPNKGAVVFPNENKKDKRQRVLSFSYFYFSLETSDSYCE